MKNLNAHTNKTKKTIVLFLTIYGLAAFYLGYTKFFETIPRQLFGLTIVLVTASIVSVYFRNADIRNFFNSIPLKNLALIHAYRIFAGSVFLVYQHQLPAAFALEGGYGDVISGFIAIAVFLFFSNSTGYLVLNAVGLVDLVNALYHGMVLALSGNPHMAALTELPIIMIPLFMVPPTIFMHIVSVYRIVKQVLSGRDSNNFSEQAVSGASNE